MTVTTQRHVPDPEHGRPRILTMKGSQGELSVHVNREDGALWLFARGPRGGGRGEFCVPMTRAAGLALWTQEPDAPIYGAEHWLRLARWPNAAQEGWELVLMKSVMGRHFKLMLDDAAREELLLCLREWARVSTVVLAEREAAA